MAHLKYFQKYNSFCSLIKDTKKWKELYKERSSIIAIILTITFSCLLSYIFYYKPCAFVKEMSNLIEVLIPALIGLLGFYIAGLAILASLIDMKTICILDKQSKIENLVGVLFCYYFAGAAILVTIIDLLFCYLCFIINLPVPVAFVYFFILMSCLLFFFSICYTVALLGSCINFLFLMFHLQGCSGKTFEKEK